MQSKSFQILDSRIQSQRVLHVRLHLIIVVRLENLSQELHENEVSHQKASYRYRYVTFNDFFKQVTNSYSNQKKVISFIYYSYWKNIFTTLHLLSISKFINLLYTQEICHFVNLLPYSIFLRTHNTLNGLFRAL